MVFLLMAQVNPSLSTVILCIVRLLPSVLLYISSTAGSVGAAYQCQDLMLPESPPYGINN